LVDINTVTDTEISSSRVYLIKQLCVFSPKWS